MADVDAERYVARTEHTMPSPATAQTSQSVMTPMSRTTTHNRTHPADQPESGRVNLIAQAQDSDRANERDLPDGVEEEVQYATMTATNLFVGSVTGCVEGTSRAVSPEQSALALTLTTATIVAFAVDHQHPATSLLAASSDKPVVEPLFPTTVQMHDARPLEVGAQPMSVMGFANNNTRVRVHLDSGASSSAVSEAWCHRHRDIVTPTLGNGGRSQRLTFTGFTAGETGATHTVVIKVTIGRTSFVNRFWVVRDCPVDLLIGQDNMGSDEGKGMHLFPDPRRGTVLFEATGEKVACVSSDAPAPTVCLLQDVAAQPESMALLPVRTPHRSTTLHIAAQAKDGWYAHEQVVCTDELGMTHMFIANSGVDTELWEKHRPFNIAMSGTSASSVTAIMQTQTSRAGTRMKDDTDTTTIEDFAASREGGSRPDAPVTGEDLKRGSMWQPCATIDAEKKRPMTEKELSAHLTSLVRANKLLSRQQRARLLAVLLANQRVFSAEGRAVGRIKDVTISFALHDHRPNFVPVRPMTPGAEQEVIRQAEGWIKDGLCHPTKSPNNFPLLLIAKKPGEPPRCATDLRRFNGTYTGEWYPVPSIRAIVAQITQSTFFSSFDATQAFQSLELATDDGVIPSSHMLAFTLPDGRRYAWSRLPYGVKDATFSFSRALAQILRPLMPNVSNYVDDIVCHSNGIEEQIDLIGRLLKRLLEQGVLLNPRKVVLVATEIDVLGLTVSHETVRPQTEKIAAIADLAPPTCREDVQHVLGVLGWSRQFVKEYATVVSPINALLKGHANDHAWPACWTTDCAAAFKQLQQALLDDVWLAAPDFGRPMEIWADASKTAIGATLMQQDAAGEYHVVEYMSMPLRDGEPNYAACELEALAVLRAVERFRPLLLYGPRFKLHVRSDHRGLVSLYRHSDESSRLFKWAQDLAEFDYEIHWHAGKSTAAQLPDGLSRSRMLLQPVVLLLDAAAADQRCGRHSQCSRPPQHRGLCDRKRKQTCQASSYCSLGQDHTGDCDDEARPRFNCCSRSPQCSKSDRHIGGCNKALRTKDTCTAGRYCSKNNTTPTSATRPYSRSQPSSTTISCAAPSEGTACKAFG